MKAVLAGTVIAEADESDLARIEGNWYFPPASITEGALVESPTQYTCPWKGDAQYYSCLLYTSPSPRDQRGSRMPSSA